MGRDNLSAVLELVAHEAIFGRGWFFERDVHTYDCIWWWDRGRVNGYLFEEIGAKLIEPMPDNSNTEKEEAISK